MALLFFEGFETIGTETGIANEATVNARLAKRMTVHNPTGGSSNMYLIASDIGYSYHMGNGSANYIQYELPSDLQVRTGSDSPIFVIGFHVFVPSPEKSFPLIYLRHSGGFEPNLYIDGTDLQFRVVADIADIAEDVLNAGQWNYIEWRIRADGTGGYTGTAAVTGTPADEDQTVSFTSLDVALYPWYKTEEYSHTGPDEVQYDGRAYQAEEVVIDMVTQTNLDKRPDLYSDASDPDNYFWQDIGTADANKPTQIWGGTQFWFEGHPETIYLADDPGPYTSSVNFTPALDEDNFLPVATDEIYFGPQGTYEIAVNGTTVMEADTDMRTMVNLDSRNLESIWFGGYGAGAGDDEFVGYDNIYILNDTDGLTGLLGPCTVVSVRPTADASPNDWATDPDSAPTNFSVIEANGSPENTNVYTDEDGDEDQYEHAAIGETGTDPVHAVKVEAEVKNNTAGTPSIDVAIVVSGPAEDSESTTVPYDPDTIIATMITETVPGGSDAWTVDDVDGSEAKITYDSGL